MSPITIEAISSNSISTLKRVENEAKAGVRGMVSQYDPTTRKGEIDATRAGEKQPVAFEAADGSEFKPGDAVTFMLYFGKNFHYAQDVKLDTAE
jgi:hypothetical protein